MSNPYALFMNLLPKQVKTVGKILAQYSNGSAKLQRINGVDTVIVLGSNDSYSVNDYVLVIDGVITSKLSAVQQTIEVDII
jgi:hypothetical protein